MIYTYIYLIFILKMILVSNLFNIQKCKNHALFQVVPKQLLAWGLRPLWLGGGRARFSIWICKSGDLQLHVLCPHLRLSPSGSAQSVPWSSPPGCTPLPGA